MATSLEELKKEGWFAECPWSQSSPASLVIPFEDVEEYVFKLKFDFEQRLSAAVNDAYDQGYLDGVNK